MLLLFPPSSLGAFAAARARIRRVLLFVRWFWLLEFDDERKNEKSNRLNDVAIQSKSSRVAMSESARSRCDSTR